jgi:hypothetical protein
VLLVGDQVSSVQPGVGVGVAGVGVGVAGVGVGVGDWRAQYLPPVFKVREPACSPPHTIISLPVHTAVWYSRPEGALVVLVVVQLSVSKLYLPPLFKS